jgi:multidrug resistance efflux pump
MKALVVLTAAMVSIGSVGVRVQQASPSTLRLSGTVEAVRTRTVMVPRLAGQTLSNLVITHLVAPGASVKTGELLVEFDRQEQRRIAFDRQAELADLAEQIGRKRAEQAAVRSKDETELKQSENDVARAKLEMRKNEMLPRVEAEKNSLALQQAEARFTQLRTTFGLKRTAAAADLRILEIRSERSQRALKYAEQNAQLMEVRAPFEGMVVIKTTFRNSGMVEIVQGDEVRPGTALIDIVDTSAMQVRARVNQSDIGGLAPGQPAIVRLDGFPELTFKGTVKAVGPLGASGRYTSTVRSFTAMIAIEGTHPQLLPDLTASVEVTPKGAPGRRPPS